MSYEKVAKNHSRMIIGLKQTLKAMENGQVSEVFIAEDAEVAITKKVANKAEQLGIPVVSVDSMKRLGTACGIDVGASTVAITRSN